MMAEAKKILITSQTHEIFIVREPNSGMPAFCRECGEETNLLTLDESVISPSIGTRKLMSLIEANLVHSVEASSGHLLVCQNSIRKYVNSAAHKGGEP